MTAAENDDLVHAQILQAALRLYRKHAPNKVTMDDVANASGRSRTSLYYYYKNRDEIYQAVLDFMVKETAATIRSAVLAANSNIHDRFYAFCMGKFKASDEWKSVLKEMWSVMNDDEKTKHYKMVTALHKKLLYHEGAVVNEILAAAVQQKEIREISAAERDMLAFVLSSSIRGIRNEIYDQGDPHDLTAAIQLLTGMISKWLLV